VGIMKKQFLIAALAVWSIGFSIDPSLSNSSARSIGLGNAFSALANDYSALYANPAGLAQVDHLHVGLMQHTLMDTVFNINGGAVLPMNGFTLGLGGIFSGVNNIAVTARDTSTGRVISSGTSDYSNSLFSVALASKIDLLGAPLFWGVSSKFFFEQVGGSLSYRSFGLNADAGAILQLTPAHRLSFVAHNMLPSKVSWTDNGETALDSKYTLGGLYTIAGDTEGSLIYLENQTLSLIGDVDIVNQDTSLLPRLGIEYKPFPFLSLRGGIGYENEASSSSNVSSIQKMSLGMGLNLGGLQFDYAYAIDPNNIDANNTHYFAMLFDMFSSKSDSIGNNKSYIEFESPKDKLTTYSKRQTVKGGVSPIVQMVRVNKRFVPVKGGYFETAVNLDSVGKNKIIVEALDEDRNVLSKTSIRVLYLASFKDVSPKSWAKKYVEELTSTGLMKGIDSNRFGVQDRVTRGEFATILANIAGLVFDDESKTDLSDVIGHESRGAIVSVVSEGLMKGVTPESFRPDDHVNRGAIIKALVKLDHIDMPYAITEQSYSDIAVDDPLAKYVVAGVDKGIAKGYPDGTFRPNDTVSKAELAKMLHNTYAVQVIINDLYDWNSF
jgi:hypothetical protein